MATVVEYSYIILFTISHVFPNYHYKKSPYIVTKKIDKAPSLKNAAMQ